MEHLIAQVHQLAMTMRYQLQSEGYASSPLSLPSLSPQSSPQKQASEYTITEQHRRERKRIKRQRQRQQRRQRATQSASQSPQLATQPNQPAIQSTQQVASPANTISWNTCLVKINSMGTPSYLLEGTLHRAPNMGPRKSRDITFKVVYPTGVG